MKKHITILVLLCITSLSFSQTVKTTIKGSVIDSTTNETIPYATIKVTKKETPNVALKALASDDDGKFQFDLSYQGNYTVSINYVGKHTLSHDVTVKSEKVIDLGKLMLVDNAESLSEVVVSAQKPLVSVDIDKITYNIQEDPDSKTNNVFEMLRKVPLVTITGDDQIQLKGSSNFKIYMNGKPSNMVTNNPKDVLKGMPANIVKDIQVITEPGAKYDAEGVEGIINIVTVSTSSTSGYTATISGSAGSPESYGGGLYLMLKYGKVGATVNYNYNTYKNPDGGYFTQTIDKINHTTLTEDGEMTFKGNGQFGSGELSIEIDTLNLINVNFWRYQGDSKAYALWNAGMIDQNLAPIWAHERDASSKQSYGGTDFGIDYQRTFANNKDRLFTASYKLSMSPNDIESDNNIRGILNYHDNFNKQFTDAEMLEHTVQADFITPIKSKAHSLEAGLKYILRTNDSDNGLSIFDNTSNTWKDILKDTDKFRHKSNVFSLYSGYNFRKGKWGLKAGLRYEWTQLNIKYKDSPIEKFTTDYNNLVPSATVSYQLAPTKTLRLGYNMRIARPSIWQLNPYEDTSNPNSVRQGNPNLDVSQAHSVNLSFGSFSRTLNLNLNLSYTYADNGVDNITELINGVRYTTYDNIGQRQTLGLSGYANWNISQKFSIYANANGQYIDLKSGHPQNLSNNGFWGMIYSGLQYKAPLGINVNAGFMTQSSYIFLQGKGIQFTSHNISLSKALLKDRLNIRIYCNSPFQKTRYNEQTQDTNTFSYYSKNQNRMRRIGVSVSYRLGDLKTQLKKTVRSIKNEDTSGSGQQGGQQGGQGQ